MTIAGVVEALHQIAPPALAEEWDNVGLLLGDPAAECSRVLVALDADAATVARAARIGAQLIISHHPPILKPRDRITADSPAGTVLLEAARRQIALAAAHTNLDVAPGGVNDTLAELLGLTHTQPLARCEGSPLAKIVVFTPPADLEGVLRALSQSEAGVVGNYRECTFRSPGLGTFRPLEGAQPSVGRVGERQEVEELRLEAIVPLALTEPVVAAVRAAHSYEEPAIDVYPLQGGRASLGIGRRGLLPKPVKAQTFVRRVKRRLAVPRVRTVGDLQTPVRHVALCGGSGGDFIADAARAGCQLYVTADVSYHKALDAAAQGLVVVDPGHAATEAPVIPVLTRRLCDLCPGVTFAAAAPPEAAAPYRFV